MKAMVAVMLYFSSFRRWIGLTTVINVLMSRYRRIVRS